MREILEELIVIIISGVIGLSMACFIVAGVLKYGPALMEWIMSIV